MFNKNKYFLFMISVFALSATNSIKAETYSATWAKDYAVNNYSVVYGTGSTNNPFPNVNGFGGNCTNFANQAISGGLLSITSPKTLNSSLVNGKFPSTVNSQWFYKCNSVSDSCQSPTWRGAQTMFAFSRNAVGKALRMQLVTKTALVNNALQVLDWTSVKVGDIIFADFEYSIGSTTNSVDHTMIVTETWPLHWYDWTQTAKYNNIRLTYQSNNRTNVGLGDIWRTYNYKSAFYVYRPQGYFR
jgi:hypothetical protein